MTTARQPSRADSPAVTTRRALLVGGPRGGQVHPVPKLNGGRVLIVSNPGCMRDNTCNLRYQRALENPDPGDRYIEYVYTGTA